MDYLELRIETGGIGVIDFGFLEDTIELIYNGMKDPDRFVLSLILGSPLHLRDLKTMEFYYSRDSKEINVLKYKLDVISVNPHEITLGYYSKPKQTQFLK